MPRSKAQSPAQIAVLNKKLNQFGEQYRNFVAAGDYAAALKITIQANSLMPGHPKIMGDAALCRMRLDELDTAYDLYLKACKAMPGDPNLWDGLTEVCGRLGRHDDVRTYGRNALVLKDQQVMAGYQGGACELPAIPEVSRNPKRNIIAFSLFGDSPRYCETARLNVQQAAIHLPAWTCRFYLDQSVPDSVRTNLQQEGAEVVCISAEDKERISGLMWRFLVLEDTSIDRYLLRDADSLISTREAAAVNQWVASGQHFHLMRDCFSHTELLLAGMWGGCSGVFTDVRHAMSKFIHQGKYLSQRVVDQHFLRHHIWPVARQSLLSHDPIFGFMDAIDFPAHAPHQLGEQFHVGANHGACMIHGQSTHSDGTPVEWHIVDAEDQLVCAYTSVVMNGKWSAFIPQLYAENINSQAWRVVLVG